MKLSFLPGALFLSRTDDGTFLVTVEGQEVLRTKSQRTAVAQFSKLRQEMEARFPARELTAEEKREILQRSIADSLVGHNSLGGRKKKTTAGSTRTFGG
jgi:hypothetical protein